MTFEPIASPDFDRCVHALVEEAARAAPGRVAVEFEGATLTYGELEARANRLARHLRGRGVTVESRVGVCVERSLELVVALLAVLKAGGAYVPLDPGYPGERLREMAEDAGVRLVLAQAHLAGRLSAGAAEVETLERAEAAAAGESPDPFESGAAPENLAYVLFTSGSTGRPKGVMIPHRAAARLVLSRDYCGFAPDETFLQFVPVAFDVSAFEIWGALSHGARLVVHPPHTPSLAALAALVRERGITTLWLTAGIFHPMADAHPEAFAGLRRLLSGGDVVSAAQVHRALRANPGLTFVNGYGPTEVTTFTTCHVVRSADEVGDTVPIGRPLAGTTVHLLDGRMRPVLPGEEGELYAGGDRVARGYHARPALTAERFVPDPFSGVPGARLYRTGDRARWRTETESAVLEFLGRGDDQVKIRGFRVEPGEVEAVLRAHPAVREAAVVARGDTPGSRTLVAYVVGDEAGDGDGLREWLRGRLPEHMVPSAVVALAALPVTPNGKVDRRALPEPRAVEGTARPGYVAPRTPTEELLAGAWAEVLGVGRVGVEDDAFSLGAHSLAAMRLASRVREALGVELPLAAIFDHPTVAALARVADEHARRAPEFPPILSAPREGRIPAGFQQEGVWFLQQLAPGSRSYHFQATLGIRGALDVAVLERALGEIVRRHELLRTTFPTEDGAPVQRIHAPWPVFLPVADLSRFEGEEQDEEVRRWLQSQAETPFSLTRLPLIRWSLLKLADDHHLLVQVEHHVVHDGWSVHVLLGELAALYRAFAAGEPSPLPELPVQFADHAVWHRRWMESDAARAQLGFWRARLAGSTGDLNLPFDHPRPEAPALHGAAPRFELSPRLYARLREVSRREGATLFMTMLAAFHAALARWSGQAELNVGTAVSARRQKETERLIGMFVNMVVVRADAGDDPAFRELLARVRRATLDAYAHQDVPFDAVVAAVAPEREPGRNPLFQVAFSFHDSALPDLSIPGLELELTVGLPNGSAKFDLNVIVIPHAEQRFGRGGQGMTVIWEYATELFEPETAHRLFDDYRRTLEAVAEDPGLSLSALDGRMRERGSAAAPGGAIPGGIAAADDPEDRRAEMSGHTIATLFAAAARRDPGAPAVIAGGARLTYGELDARSERLAWALRARGVGPEVRVGICLERGMEMVIAVLAVVKAGGAYVSLDPTHPPERLAFLVRDSGIRLAVSNSVFAERVPAGVEVLAVEGAAESGNGGAERIEPGAVPDTLACVLYTSGSTGEPKGVMITHRGIVRLVHDAAYADYSPGQVFLGIAPLAFDASTLELWAPLLNGAAAALFPPHAPTLEELGDFIRRNGVTAGWITAGLFRQMVDADPSAFAGMRQVMTGGEVVSPDHLRRVLRANPGLEVLHGYGPTEVTTFTTTHPLRSEADVIDPVPLGAPIAETYVRVLDEDMRPVPGGGEGELFAGGSGVARGYQARPALTAEKFVPDPFATSPGARLYRSGDRVRLKESAEVREDVSALEPRESPRTFALPHSRTAVLEFVGRVDGQVKIRGFRIEPEEIEAALMRHPSVRATAVVAREDRPGDRRLVAYLVADGAPPSAAELRAHLKARLPEHMIPAAFVALPALPLNARGKVDRRALPAPEAAQPPVPISIPPSPVPSANGYAAPRTPTEEVLAAIWAEVLDLDRVGMNDGFLALGGDAALAAQAVARVWQTLEVRLPPEAMLEAETLEALAAQVDGSRGASSNGAAADVGPTIGRAARGAFSLERLRETIQVQPGAARLDADIPYVEPRTPTERELAEIWAEVLERPRVGADDDFFLLGGHSLLATLILSRVRQTFAVELPLRSLFDAPTVAELAARVDAARVPAGSAA